MSITLSRRMVVFGLLSIGYYSGAVAGPYFNTYRTDVDALSREAVKQLGAARTAVIDMLNELDAGNRDGAESLRRRALELLFQSQKTFQEIVGKVSDRKLEFRTTTDDGKLVLVQLRNALD